MDFNDNKEKFISEWGQLCMSWGEKKAVGQIHGALLISERALSAEELMSRLRMSRGNVNMNIRELVEWGLIHKVSVIGERKEFFEAEKDFWKVFQLILMRRKRKELDPMIELLKASSNVEAQCPESDEFCKVVKELHHFSMKADKILNMFADDKDSFLSSTLMKMMR
jgi:DNA-binding transcriptional regulator GbsR (MarR family)